LQKPEITGFKKIQTFKGVHHGLLPSLLYMPTSLAPMEIQQAVTKSAFDSNLTPLPFISSSWYMTVV